MRTNLVRLAGGEAARTAAGGGADGRAPARGRVRLGGFVGSALVGPDGVPHTLEQPGPRPTILPPSIWSVSSFLPNAIPSSLNPV
jgi:hypothetical protein